MGGGRARRRKRPAQSSIADHADAAGGGAALNSPTITTPAITNPTLTASGWPSFRVTLGGVDQANITGVDKIEFDTEAFDTNDDYDNAINFRFTPTVAGKYLLILHVTWGSLTATDNINIYIYRAYSPLILSIILIYYIDII